MGKKGKEPDADTASFLKKLLEIGSQAKHSTSARSTLGSAVKYKDRGDAGRIVTAIVDGNKRPATIEQVLRTLISVLVNFAYIDKDEVLIRTTIYNAAGGFQGIQTPSAAELSWGFKGYSNAVAPLYIDLHGDDRKRMIAFVAAGKRTSAARFAADLAASSEIVLKGLQAPSPRVIDENTVAEVLAAHAREKDRYPGLSAATEQTFLDQEALRKCFDGFLEAISVETPRGFLPDATKTQGYIRAMTLAERMKEIDLLEVKEDAKPLKSGSRWTRGGSRGSGVTK